MKVITKFFWNLVYTFLGRISPKTLASIHYRRSTGKSLNWKKPQSLDEKINWLKFYSDTSRWSELADKYRVREYVANCGFENMLVPLIGKWDKAEDIEWDKLPNQFVMKTNHGSGDALICKDKQSLDTKYWTAEFSRLLSSKFGRFMGEPHYDKIVPCIIVETLLDNTKQRINSTSLVDYKIWTFDGKPAYIFVCHNRTKDSLIVGVYDLDWNFHPEFSVSTPHYKLSDQPIPRPHSLDAMLNAASRLSKGFPEVRVDFYEVDDKPYFGEMTFTASAGFISYYSPKFQNLLGSLVKL